MLYTDLLKFLQNSPDDDQIAALFQRVRINQTNGMQIKQAISHSLHTFAENSAPIPLARTFSKNNTVSYLINKYRAVILQLRSEGYGYGALAKTLAKRGVYNKETGKAFSRATIQRVCNALEQKGKM